MQTSLAADKFCVYDQSASILEWVLERGQYNNTFAIAGAPGVNANSNYVRPDVINIDSYLSGRDDVLSKCNPPIPALDDANLPPLTYQDIGSVNELTPIFSREKKSAVDLGAISYLPLTLEPSLPNPPQDINHIVFAGAAQRGGADTRNVIKQAWNEDNCESFLDPQRACGAYCSEANGYMTRMPYSRHSPEARWGDLPKGFPGSSWFTPSETGTQVGMARPQQITSQMARAVGASNGNFPQMIVPVQGTRSDIQVKSIGNPYNRFPKETSPITHHEFPTSPIYNLVPH